MGLKPLWRVQTATDSAAPVSMMLELAEALSGLLEASLICILI